MRRCRLTLLLTLLGLSACGDPCKTLAEKVCRCEVDLSEQNACLKKVDAQASQRNKDSNAKAEQAGRERCAALIDTCTCDGLRDGNLQSCGLSQE